jgi:DDE superfamily endonuclease
MAMSSRCRHAAGRFQNIPVPASLTELLGTFRGCFTARSFATFMAMVVGLAAQPGRRTVCGMLAGAGLQRSWSHHRAHRFFSHAKWSLDEVCVRLAQLIAARLVGEGERVRIVVDDTLFHRVGKKVFAAAWQHDGSAKGPNKVGRGNCFVVAAILVDLPFCSRPVALTALFRLWCPAVKDSKDTKGGNTKNSKGGGNAKGSGKTKNSKAGRTAKAGGNAKGGKAKKSSTSSRAGKCGAGQDCPSKTALPARPQRLRHRAVLHRPRRDRRRNHRRLRRALAPRDRVRKRQAAHRSRPGPHPYPGSRRAHCPVRAAGPIPDHRLVRVARQLQRGRRPAPQPSAVVPDEDRPVLPGHGRHAPPGHNRGPI